MNPWHDISVGDGAPEVIRMIVEIPKDSSVKYEVDKDSGLLLLDRFLHTAHHYPADYGFVPQTLWEDGDPLDVFVLTDRPIYPMTLCEVRVIGVIHMVDDGESDDKVIGVYKGDPRFKEWDSLDKVPEHYVKEMTNFLLRYKELQNKVVEITGVSGVEKAHECVKKGQELYQEKYAKSQTQ